MHDQSYGRRRSGGFPSWCAWSSAPVGVERKKPESYDKSRPRAGTAYGSCCLRITCGVLDRYTREAKGFGSVSSGVSCADEDAAPIIGRGELFTSASMLPSMGSTPSWWDMKRARNGTLASVSMVLYLFVTAIRF